MVFMMVQFHKDTIPSRDSPADLLLGNSVASSVLATSFHLQGHTCCKTKAEVLHKLKKLPGHVGFQD